MKSAPAIVEPSKIDVDLLEKQAAVALAGQRDAERSAGRHEQLGAAARETAKLRRLEVGRALLKLRMAWPASGPKAKGWSECLSRLGIDDSTAWRYMDEVKNPKPAREDPSQSAPVRENSGPELALVPDPQDETEPEVEIDRDTWCTPTWLTDPLGRFDLDPCWNDRSSVGAGVVYELARGFDGLELAPKADPGCRVFINPPYSDVGPWIAAYKHTRFCFLLKLDTSTKWFAELHAASALILIPRRRVNFEPPPGVPPEKAIAQQFPHALFYARAEDATPEIRALCWHWRVDHDPTNN